MDTFLQAAFDEAKEGLKEGGIPIGSVIVYKEKLLGVDTIGEYKKEASSFMLKWMHLKMRGDNRHRFIANALYTQPSPLARCVPVQCCFTEFQKSLLAKTKLFSAMKHY